MVPHYKRQGWYDFMNQYDFFMAHMIYLPSNCDSISKVSFVIFFTLLIILSHSRSE